jgi:GMP reductase
MEKYYSYQEVFLEPKFSEYRSRSEVDTSVKIGGKVFKLPIIPANMKCVMDVDRARWMSENDYFYIMHRFGKKNSLTHEQVDLDNKEFVAIANLEKWKTISISLGVIERDRDFLNFCAARELRIDFITLDIAHGHSVAMRDMLKFVRSHRYYKNVVVIAGNIASAQAAKDLASWGASIIKVGIAQGGACTTFGKTGFGSPMFSIVKKCASASWIPIIADGGIRTNGDIAKALSAGAQLVMAGGLFAATKDSPAVTVYKPYDGIGRHESIATHKIYYGSASEDNTHSTHHIEGTRINLPIDRWTYAEKLIEIQEDLQSSISYAGGDLTTAVWGVRTA